jgi:two-component system cell cycle sensor histidine kinase PleC
MIEDCCHLLRAQADRKQITMDFERVRGLPKVCGDLRATTQVLVNLIGGAIRYLPQGSAITIASGRTESGAGYLLIEDNGPRQSARDAQALLDPWTYRPATKAEEGRGGLGLLLARRLMEAQGGRLVIESSPNAGTRIACQFAPVASEESANLAVVS